jgi:hypothetical protein
MQVFQQPDTACAVHGWEVKLDVRLVLIAKSQQFEDHLFIIQVGKTSICEPAFGLDAGVFLEVVVIAKVILVKQQKYLFTAFATKEFLFDLDRLVTSFPAMVTRMLHWLTFARQISSASRDIQMIFVSENADDKEPESRKGREAEF